MVPMFSKYTLQGSTKSFSLSQLRKKQCWDKPCHEWSCKDRNKYATLWWHNEISTAVVPEISVVILTFRYPMYCIVQYCHCVLVVYVSNLHLGIYVIPTTSCGQCHTDHLKKTKITKKCEYFLYFPGERGTELEHISVNHKLINPRWTKHKFVFSSHKTWWGKCANVKYSSIFICVYKFDLFFDYLGLQIKKKYFNQCTEPSLPITIIFTQIWNFTPRLWTSRCF